MIIVGFEDHPDGQRRVIVKDLVGGLALKDEWGPTPALAASTGPAGPATISPGRQTLGGWIWKEDPETDIPKTSHKRKVLRARAIWSTSPTSATASATAPQTATPPSPTHFPPSGGVGLHLVAIWSYYPEPGDTDEIFFPRGAEITEAENINDDWLWGCYAGQKGLFPGGYGRIIGEVGHV